VSINFVDQANAANHYTMPPPLQDQFKNEYDSKIHIISAVKQHGENCAFYHKSSAIKYKHISHNIIAERTKYFDNTKNNTKVQLHNIRLKVMQ